MKPFKNSSLLHQFLNKNRTNKLNIHCVGDAMIDEYYDVKVKRISPEAPMPIMHSATEDCIKRPGGVANVAYQFKHFNVDSQLICFSDLAATAVFREHKLRYTPCSMKSTILPRKRRFVDHYVQVNRWDIESKNYGLEDITTASAESLSFTEHLPIPQVAILSDYDKGFFNLTKQDWIQRYKDTITIVDPKHGPIDQWKNCTIFKPNEKEAYELSGIDNWEEQCKHFIKELHCKFVVITQGGNGVVACDDLYNFYEYRPNYNITPESVIGAGDCFAAFLAMAVGQGFKVFEAVQIAYEAGAIYIQNKMNRPIIPAELCKNKIVSPTDLNSRDFRLVFTNGCFDAGLTLGHIDCIKFAKQQGDKLVVALNSNDSIRKLKGNNRPIFDLCTRLQIMAALKEVDFVTWFDEDTPYDIIKTIKPDLIVKGGDYKKQDVVGHDIVDVLICPLTECLSTTDKINIIYDNANN